MGAEDPRLAADHVGGARAGLDDRHTMPQREFQERLGRIEAVDDPGVGLVRVAALVLILVGRQVEPARDPQHRVRVDQARRDDRSRKEGRARGHLRTRGVAGVADLPILNQDEAVPDRRPMDCVEQAGPDGDALDLAGDLLGTAGLGRLNLGLGSGRGGRLGPGRWLGQGEAADGVVALAPQGAIVAFPPLDIGLQDLGVDAERAPRQDDEVGILAGLDRADLVAPGATLRRGSASMPEAPPPPRARRASPGSRSEAGTVTR